MLVNYRFTPVILEQKAYFSQTKQSLGFRGGASDDEKPRDPVLVIGLGSSLGYQASWYFQHGGNFVKQS